MLKPTDTDFICGYLNPSVVSSSGSQSLKSENVSRLVPLANKRQPRMPILVVQRCGRVYPSSRFFKRRKLMSRNHHVEACSLFATALSPIRGQNTSCLGFSGVQRSSMFERLIAYCSSKTIDNLGNTCTTNGCFIYCGHFTIPVQIFVFNVTGT